jgi:NTE family protein
LAELRAIAFVRDLLDTGVMQAGTMKRVMLHMIEDDALMNDLNFATKTIPVPVVLKQLKSAGRAAMDTFLINHKDDLGKRETLDLNGMFN